MERILRVMIVDDEPVIRFGIKASIDWEREGYQVIGDYANGAQALERMKSEPPDILITDIKMPVMDGLELTRNALQLNPDLKVILVSSYNDFDYVREGLKLGVADYILKPTLEPEDLLQIVHKCAEKIRKSERLESRLHEAFAESTERERRMYEHSLKRILVHRKTEPAADGWPEWLNSPYAAVYVMLNQVGAMEERYGFLHKSIIIDSLIDAIYQSYPEGIAFPTAENELFFMMPQRGELEQELAQLKVRLEAETEINVSFGYETGIGGNTVQESFQRSMKACRRSFFQGEGIYRHENGEPDAHDAASSSPCCLPDMLQTSGDLSLSDERMDDLLERWRYCWAKGGKTAEQLKEEACKVLSILFKSSADSYALVECFDSLFKAETLEELCRLLKEQIGELRKLGSDRFDSIAAHNPIAKALDYIRAHYLETLTLQQVADAVHISRNYFSILFKKHTGQNFIDFLIHLRVQRAKELLSNTELKVYEVAEQSGFNDVKYFSKLFKKITGFSPMDYREMQ